jgi:hypothetical protein
LYLQLLVPLLPPPITSERTMGLCPRCRLCQARCLIASYRCTSTGMPSLFLLTSTNSDVDGKYGLPDRCHNCMRLRSYFGINSTDHTGKTTFANLAKQGILLEQSYSLTHPSQPNYVAAISGDFFGMDDDNLHNIPPKYVQYYER